MKKIVVTGSNGQLAKDIVERLREFSLSYRVYDFDRKALDVTDKDALEKSLKIMNQMFGYKVQVITLLKK